MEVNAIKTFVDCLCKSAFTHLLDANLVREGTVLVKLSEQGVELFKGSRVLGIHGPERGARHWSVSSLELINYLIEVPREGKHICMLLLRELNIDSESGIFVSGINLVLILLLRNNRGIRELS